MKKLLWKSQKTLFYKLILMFYHWKENLQLAKIEKMYFILAS